MKKTLFKKLLCVVMALLTMTVAASCGAKGDNSSKKDDPTKTKLTIFTYKAGYGDQWLVNLCKAFEEAYAVAKQYVGEHPKTILMPEGSLTVPRVA